MCKRTCGACQYWISGIPAGTCNHPKGLFMQFTSDKMVFDDAGKSCPLNILEANKNYIENIKFFEEKLGAFLKEKGVKGAVVGISGGKDSTIVAKLMCDILGKENVIGVLMPCGEQADIADSQRVVDLLDIKHITVNIKDAFSSLLESVDVPLAVQGYKGVSEAAEINLAPRLRMSVLYSVAQSMGNGWRVIGTTNKSEEYIGWLTKWGDGACDIEPIIGFTVSELRILGVNLGLPKELVHKVPIDGLTSNTDEERFGFSYEQLDKYIETGDSGDDKINKKIKIMHENSQHKREPIPMFS